jgi:alpha-ketoglutarate-dependent taurine dioxygenase
MRFSRDDHAAEAPIIDDSGEDVLIRYAHDALNSSAPEHHALRAKFSAFLESSVAQTGATAIKLTEGDVLFFDNRRLLHAREPYSDPNRLNIRVRISDPRSVA